MSEEKPELLCDSGPMSPARLRQECALRLYVSLLEQEAEEPAKHAWIEADTFMAFSPDQPDE